jgi:FdhD protein
MSSVPSPSVSVRRSIWRADAVETGERRIPEETPIALTYGRVTHAVMMATPDDLRDFALGFSLAEGIVSGSDDIESLDIVVANDGIELRMDLIESRSESFVGRRRHITGPGGCGLCGMDSLAEAVRPAAPVESDARFTGTDIQAAVAAMQPAQSLNLGTRAVHAAAFWTPKVGLWAIREDVGRHNALDKLAGALAWSGQSAVDGVVVLSSRISVEMVQKAAAMGVPVIAAVSAPTALAVRVAEAAGLTLIGVARPDSFEVFTHPHRIRTGPARHVA